MIQNLVSLPIRKVEQSIYSCLNKPRSESYDKKARFFEFLAGNFLYNKLMWGTSPGDYVHYAREVLASCEGTVADIGCGGLMQTSKLYAARPQFTVLTDISLQMLRIGKHRIIQQNGTLPHHLSFLQADAFKLPFYDAVVDNVVSFGMLHLLDDKRAFIQELLRILKRGGSFHISAMTNDRPLSRKYIRMLQRKQAFATAMSSEEIIQLFHQHSSRIQHYTIGSMVFISGIK